MMSASVFEIHRERGGYRCWSRRSFSEIFERQERSFTNRLLAEFVRRIDFHTRRSLTNTTHRKHVPVLLYKDDGLLCRVAVNRGKLRTAPTTQSPTTRNGTVPLCDPRCEQSRPRSLAGANEYCRMDSETDTCLRDASVSR